AAVRCNFWFGGQPFALAENISLTLRCEQLAVYDLRGIVFLVRQKDIDGFTVRMSQASADGVSFFSLAWGNRSHIQTKADRAHFILRCLRTKRLNEEFDKFLRGWVFLASIRRSLFYLARGRHRRAKWIEFAVVREHVLREREQRAQQGIEIFARHDEVLCLFRRRTFRISCRAGCNDFNPRRNRMPPGLLQ